jgi:hypothetical protein
MGTPHKRSIAFSQEQRAKLIAEAERRELTVSDLVRDLVDRYFRHKELLVEVPDEAEKK